MNKYIVHPGQNIFDVAVAIYGTIEGLSDLMKNNAHLSMASDLNKGDILLYDNEAVINQPTVDILNKKGIVPANGERSVYYKEVKEDLIALYTIDPNVGSIHIGVAGGGVLVVDWGDNSVVERVTLTPTVQTLWHSFDNKTFNREIRIYGAVSLTWLDLCGEEGMFRPVRPVIVDEFQNIGSNSPLNGLFLLKDTYSVNLRNCVIRDLLPIGQMSLQSLDLRGVRYVPGVKVLDSYLTYIVEHYGQRRNCEVYLSSEPGPQGMAAIEKIIGEPEWNAAGKWKFIINDKIYTAS